MQPLQFYIDVSGQPTSEVGIGLVSIQSHQISKIISDVKKKYPQFMRNKQKAAKMDPRHIKSIISFLNGRGVRMVCTRFKARSWNELTSYIGAGKQHKYEMIFAALYFETLKRHSSQNSNYPLTVCLESFLDIQKVIIYLKKLSKAHKMDYQVSMSQSRYTEMLKFADLVASAGRKLDPIEHEFFTLQTPDLNLLKYYLRKLKED